jgi:hypothetical protein
VRRPSGAFVRKRWPKAEQSGSGDLIVFLWFMYSGLCELFQRIPNLPDVRPQTIRTKIVEEIYMFYPGGI